MKICFVGCGHIAGRAHGPAFARLAREQPDLSLAACCDPDLARAQQVRSRFGFGRAYGDLDEMIAAERPDAVCILVPPEVAPGVILAVLDRGVPALIEKPPALRARTLRALIARARRTRVPHQVAFNRRHMPFMKLLKERLAASAPDRSPVVLYDLFRTGRLDPDFSTTAIHAIDGARFLSGSAYRRASLRYQVQSGPGAPVTNFLVEAEMEGGGAAVINIHPNVGLSVERAVVHSGGATWFVELPIWNAFDYPGSLVGVEKGAVVFERSGADAPGGEVFETGGFYDQAASFVADLRAGRFPKDDLESALQPVEMAERIRQRRARYG